MNRFPVFLVLATCSSLALGADQTFSQSIAAQLDGKVTISNVSGPVEIFTWDKPELGVEGEIGAGVDHVEVTGTGGNSEVRVMLKKGNYREGDARLKVTLPAGSRIEAIVTSGALTLHGPYDSARLQVVSGSTNVDGEGRELDVRSVSGNVQISGGARSMRTRVESVSGSVRVRDVSGELSVQSTSGTVEISMPVADEIRARSISGKLGITANLSTNASVDAEATGSAIDLKLSAAGGYRYDLSNFGGGVSNCFADGAKTGTLGNGGANVRARSFGGRISLCDKLN